ncbi:hypothetical protein PCH70_30580 [Pseudomonas cichorii JBC1]|nr:hypothetical protein PCH70_30580 [Pseudomonas cichorii JBC1]
MTQFHWLRAFWAVWQSRKWSVASMLLRSVVRVIAFASAQHKSRLPR